MNTMITREEKIKSLQRFKRLRDALLHEDITEIQHHLQRFVNFCRNDELVQEVLQSLYAKYKINSEEWWKQVSNVEYYHRGIDQISFPDNPEEETILRFTILVDVAEKSELFWTFGHAIQGSKLSEFQEAFRSIVVRPVCEELSNLLGEATSMATPEARNLQAVPLNRIPDHRQSRIFLSHKSVDKPLVQKYYDALYALGFDPWLDKPEMPAGTNLERGILEGFEQSCAAVFFITENFKDEKYLATEIDYAINQKRKKENRFSIITLCFSPDFEIPSLLQTYTYANVTDDLQGFHEIIRALPIELGPIRWKEYVVS